MYTRREEMIIRDEVCNFHDRQHKKTLAIVEKNRIIAKKAVRWFKKSSMTIYSLETVKLHLATIWEGLEDKWERQEYELEQGGGTGLFYI